MGSVDGEWALMKNEPQIFTRTNVQDVPVNDDILDALEQDEIMENVLGEYIRSLLTEVPIGDVEWVDDDYPKKSKKEPLFTAAELEDYFKGIPETVNVYIAHTDDFRWAAKLPYGNTGKMPDHIGLSLIHI